MPYSTIDNLLELMPEKNLIDISNDEGGAETVNLDNVVAAIAKADSVIDGYVGAQKKVPLDPVPGLVQTLSCNLAIFFLYRRLGMVPDIWQDQYKADTAVLVKISTGQISLGVASGEAAKEPPAQALTNSSPKIMGGPNGLLSKF